MDNNGPLPNQPLPNQPVPPMLDQPNNVQPVPNQPMPAQPMQPTPGQPMAQPMPPYPGQPYPPQPMMKSPKQPMDPAKKKKIILIVSICSGVAILGIVAAIIIPILLRVDYSSAYKTAKELSPKIYDIYHSYDCEYVVDYYNSTYTNTKTYNEYIENCLAVYDNGASDLVTKLGDTDGIKRNTDLKNQYDKFSSEFNALTSGSATNLSSKLDVYKAWHTFVVAVDDLDYRNSSDAEFTAAANYLIESGNDTLKTYGEGWLERQLGVAAAYRAWYNASYSDPNYSEYRNAYNNKNTEIKDWIAANKPDIQTLAPLNIDDTSKMNSAFSSLYDMIRATYEKNYNSGSGDCTEFMGEVSCS